MADVFISYSRVDQPIIKQLSQTLEKHGYSVWWDRELLGGDSFADDIERELMSAKAVIVSWSESGSKSRWVRDEAAIAADAGTLIAISTDGTNPPIGFRQFHCVDFSSWQQQADSYALNEVLRAISARITTTAKTSEYAEQTSSYVSPAVPLTRKPASVNSDDKIVAVLPFANRSPLSDDAYFADGIHDELITHISSLEAIQVISRTSVMGYRDMTKSIPEIANELGASVVLEGAVQRSGKRVRINAQLINGKSDTSIWSDKYDRDLSPENIFDIQSEITREIATALHSVLSKADENILSSAAPTNNLKAYDAYLRGKQKIRSEATGVQDFHAAITEFDKAIEDDANFAEPYANKARTYLTIYWFFGWEKTWLEKAQIAVQKAILLAPESIETMLAQAYFHYWGELDLVNAEAVLNRILKKSPQNTEAWACKSYVIRRSGRFIESITALQNAQRLDPMLIDIPMELSNTFAAIGQIDLAMEMLNRVYALAPRANFTAITAADVNYYAGDAKLAFEKANIKVDLPDFVYYYRRTFHALNTNNAENIDYALSTWPEEYYGNQMYPETYPLYYATACLQLNRHDEAQSILKEIKERIDSSINPYPAGWMPEAAYYPVTLPGLMGDIEAVREAVNQFEANAKLDQWGTIYHYHAIASAFLQCGDNESALTYLEKLSVIFGPCAYLLMSITPLYALLHNQPRYQALKRDCEHWQSSTQHYSQKAHV